MKKHDSSKQGLSRQLIYVAPFHVHSWAAYISSNEAQE